MIIVIEVITSFSGFILLFTVLLDAYNGHLFAEVTQIFRGEILLCHLEITVVSFIVVALQWTRFSDLQSSLDTLWWNFKNQITNFVEWSPVTLYQWFPNYFGHGTPKFVANYRGTLHGFESATFQNLTSNIKWNKYYFCIQILLN